MKNLQTFEDFINEASKKRPILPYSKIKIGDIAFENPSLGGGWDNELGPIMWKGGAKELLKSKYKNTAADWFSDEDTEEIDSDYDLVVVDEIGYGPVLFNYNNDPSGVVCFAK